MPVGIFVKVRRPQVSPTPLPQPQFADLAGSIPQQDAIGGVPTIITSSPGENTPLPLQGWPVQGKINQGFGCSPYFTGIRSQNCEAPLPWFHDGVDIAAVEGKPVRAMIAGTVIFAGADGTGPVCGEYHGFGQGVVLDNGDGWQTLYAHLSRIDVQVGDVVTPQTLIGAVGKTGCVTGAHLHFGLRHNGDLVNPKEYVLP
jgi:murein DD-endopeptidase MepM/ murein hydrolase activator NlpD